MKLQKDGRGYSTITSVRGVVKPAFQMAYEEDILRKNPFDFKLTDVVKNDSQKRIALTREREDILLNFNRSLQYLMGHSGAESITVTFAGRGAQVGMTLGHFSYTKFTPFGWKAP